MRQRLHILGIGSFLLWLWSGPSLYADTPPSRLPSMVSEQQGPAFPFRDAYADDTGGSGHQEHNLLTLSRQSVVLGDTFSADIRIYDDGGYDYYFNVYWDRSLPLPGELALYDSKKHWVRDLTARTGVSPRKPEPGDWTPICSPGYAGIVVNCGPLSVPVGTYYVQAIFFGSLIHPPPDRSTDGWPALDDQTELMRSDAIPITVVAPVVVRSGARLNDLRRHSASLDPMTKPTARRQPQSATAVSPSAPGSVQPAISAPSSADQGYPFRDAYPLLRSKPWERAVHGLLIVPNRSLHQDDPFDVEIRLYNDSGWAQFYNVYWHRLINQPGVLALYDTQKRYVCDLVAYSNGSHRTFNFEDWTGIQAPGYAGTIMSLRLPHLRRIPAGTYYMQVIYQALTVSPPTNAEYTLSVPSEAQRALWEKKYALWSTEVFRSNVVEVSVVD